MMKKSILVFVLLMFMFNVIAIADNGDVSDTDVDTDIDIDVDDVTEEVITEEECGFWCETYKFLFGDAELRAATGTAWFDRQDALVGFAGGNWEPKEAAKANIRTSCQLASSGDLCWGKDNRLYFRGSEQDVFGNHLDSYYNVKINDDGSLGVVGNKFKEQGGDPTTDTDAGKGGTKTKYNAISSPTIISLTSEGSTSTTQLKLPYGAKSGDYGVAYGFNSKKPYSYNKKTGEVYRSDGSKRTAFLYDGENQEWVSTKNFKTLKAYRASLDVEETIGGDQELSVDEDGPAEFDKGEREKIGDFEGEDIFVDDEGNLFHSNGDEVTSMKIGNKIAKSGKYLAFTGEFSKAGDAYSDAGDYSNAAVYYSLAGKTLQEEGYSALAVEEFNKAGDLYMELEAYSQAAEAFQQAGNEESAKYASEQADLAAVSAGSVFSGDSSSGGSGSGEGEEKKPEPKKEVKSEAKPEEEPVGKAKEYELGSLEDLEIFEEDKVSTEELRVNAIKDGLETMAELTKQSEELNNVGKTLVDEHEEASNNLLEINKLLADQSDTTNMKTTLEDKKKTSLKNVALNGKTVDDLSAEIIKLKAGLNKLPSESAKAVVQDNIDKKVAEKEVLERNIELENTKLELIDGQLKVLSGELQSVEQLEAKLAEVKIKSDSLVGQQNNLQSQIATLQKDIDSPPEGIGNTFTLPDNKLNDQGFAYVESSAAFVNSNGDVLTPKDDGTSTLEVKGGDATLYTVTYPAEGSDAGAKLEFGDGWDNLKGDYSDNKEIIDELHTLGFIDDDKYKDITGGSGWDLGIFNSEASMSDAKEIIGTPVVKTFTAGNEISVPSAATPSAPKKMAEAEAFMMQNGVVYEKFNAPGESGTRNVHYINSETNVVYDKSGFAVGKVENNKIVFDTQIIAPFLETDRMIFLGNPNEKVTVPPSLPVPSSGKVIADDNPGLVQSLESLVYNPGSYSEDLNAKNYYGNTLNADGDPASSAEEAALIIFQTDNGLTPDGKAGPLTVKKLNDKNIEKRIALDKHQAKKKAEAAKKAEEEKKAVGTESDDDAEKKVVAPPETLDTIFASAQGIQQAVVCFETGRNCKSVDGEKVELTHSGASEKMAVLAKTAREDADELFFKGPVLGPSGLTTPSVGATIKIGDKTYTKTEITDKDGKKFQWLDENKKPATEEELAKAEDLALPGQKEAEKQAKELEEAAETLGWQGSWLEWKDGDSYRALAKGDWAGGQTIGGLASVAGKLGSYQAISNALFPETTKSWMDAANTEFLNEWADLPAFASQGICEEDDYKRSELPGKASAFVRTQSGSYQFVGQIQAEKSKVETDILCEINDEDELYCKDEQVCIDNFCYLDEDENGKPDEDLPLKGKYYKINWGVTAPQDESHTPYIDEDGKAVKFNIRLEGDGEVWLYKRKGAINEGVIELENGASDGGTLIKFLNEDYSEVCIYFHDDYKITDYWGDSVDEICADFILVSKGTVEASGSGTDSVTSSSAGVEENV